jgi:hypothetical protein
MSVEREPVVMPASNPHDGVLAGRVERDIEPTASAHRQINERRAQVENTELLRRLRGL